jgi:antitoxin component of MazEF toxin-antitoxin module
MKIMKVRRVGNSNVISIPRELEGVGYAPGSEVVVEQLDSGELRVIPAGALRKLMRKSARRVVKEDREALRILADHDKSARRRS